MKRPIFNTELEKLEDQFNALTLTKNNHEKAIKNMVEKMELLEVQISAIKTFLRTNP